MSIQEILSLLRQGEQLVLVKTPEMARLPQFGVVIASGPENIQHELKKREWHGVSNLGES